MTFTIKNSYKLQSRLEINTHLLLTKIENPDNEVLKSRSMGSLRREWCGHNLLYNLHLFRSHTKDVDFESPQRWYYATFWTILSLFYWH